MKNRLTIIVTTVMAVTGLVSCGDSRPDPKGAYPELEASVLKGDGGLVYDMLDSAMRAQQDKGMQMQVQMKDQLPAEDKAKMEQISKAKPGRDAFAKMFELNKEQMTGRFKGKNVVVRVDTLYALTVQREDKGTDVMLFRWENGKYRYTTGPQSQPAPQQTPPQAPPTQAPPAAGGSTPVKPPPAAAAPHSAPAPQGK